MFQPRPVAGDFSSTVKDFHLREVVCVQTAKFDQTLWCFGNTRDHRSVAIQVANFHPYVYLECPADLGVVDEWLALMNDDLRPFEAASDVLVEARTVERVPVIGFCDNRADTILQLFYRNPSDLYRIKRHFENEVHCGAKPRRLELFHVEVRAETLFLHETGLQLQSWVTVTGHARRTAATVCTIELDARATGFRPLALTVPIPPILCCSLRGQMAGAQLEVICAELYWLDAPGSRVFHWTGADLFRQMSTMLDTFDVDVFQFLSDHHNILYECAAKNVRLSKFKDPVTRLLRSPEGRIYGVVHPGRSAMDIRSAMQKMMIEPKLDGFTLHDALLHPTIVRDSPGGAHDLVLADQVQWLSKIEQNNYMLLGFLEISCASYTALTATVINGQQIRVWNKLVQKFHTEKLYVNRSQLDRPSVVVQRAKADSSFPDPPIQVVNAKQRQTIHGRVDVVKKKSAKRHEGGFVMEPKRGFYNKLGEAVFTFDFGSLYPSIVRGNKICYMRVVFDKKYLDDPNFIKEYVAINDTECIVLVKARRDGGVVRTVLPQTIDEVCEERTRAKKQMKSATDPFLRASFNAKQLGCKVFQNAVYGFLGVEKNGMLALPILMATVCRIGQFMIKQVRYMMESEHQAVTIYGDTDSVMVSFPHPPELVTQEAVFDYYYALAKRLADKGTALFPKPNVLEFEAMKYPFALYQKKNYFAMEYGDRDWRDAPTLTVKGLAYKKRDRCAFVRNVGLAVIKALVADDMTRITQIIRLAMTALVEGRVGYENLAVTCLLQAEDDYKTDRLIQLRTARRVAARTGKPIQAGSRLSYVVVAGQAPYYERGRETAMAKQAGLQLDFQYYLEKQFLPAITPLLMFHPQAEVQREVAAARAAIVRRVHGIGSLRDAFKKRQKRAPNLN